MLELILKVVGVVFLVYIIWFFTGGPQRGEERVANGTNTIFIGVDGTPIGDGEERFINSGVLPGSR